MVYAKNINYKKIDEYALEAPMLKTDNLNRLVKYLIEPYKKDEEKARVLLAWIVHHIDYDRYKALSIEKNVESGGANVLKIPNNDILETRLGVCGDIAQLYQQMAEYAGLEVELIEGWAGVDKSRKEIEQGVGHIWTAVKIDGEWEYVDPTWAIGGDNTQVMEDVSKGWKYNQKMKKRARKESEIKKARKGRFVEDEWFLTDKAKMILTHYPDDEKWQLQKKKITRKEFIKLNENSSLSRSIEKKEKWRKQKWRKQK